MLEELGFDLPALLAPSPLSVYLALSLGLIVGSFLNVAIYRLPLQKSCVFPGSACGSCGTPLKFHNNIPLLSYLFQRGLCQFCGAPYSIRYFLIELLCGAVALGLLFWNGGLGVLWIFHFVFFCLALAVFWTDVDHWIIPDEMNAFGLVFGCCISSLLPPRGDMLIFEDLFGLNLEIFGWSLRGNLASSLLGILVGWAFFKVIQKLGLVLAKQDAMGEGDVKYAAVLGALLGWQMALGTFFLSFFLGALYALPLMLLSRGRGKDPVPFGTFMSLAAVPVAWGGPQLYEQFLLWGGL